jgi:Protein of unknown function (DUF2934)
MSLIHYAKPFLELGICKEYSMPRKANGNGTATRSKKTTVQSGVAEVAPEVIKEEITDVVNPEAAASAVARDLTSEVRQTAKPALNLVPHNPGPRDINIDVNIEDEIRRRAYELYLQRRAVLGGGGGDQNQDWLMAEREIRSRHNGHPRATT